MKRKTSKIVASALKALLRLAMGILFFVFPSSTLNMAYYVYLSFILADGALSLGLFFLSFGASSLFGITLISSILKILFAVLGLVNPSFFQGFFSVFLALYIALVCCGDLIESFVRRQRGAAYLFPILLSALCLSGAIALVFVPALDKGSAYGILAGILLSLEAILRFYLLFLPHWSKRPKKEEEEAIDVEVVEE